MKLALYKGPASDIMHKIGHKGICIVTRSIYSHCELVIDGWCYSASSRDGGVRRKEVTENPLESDHKIYLKSGKWDVYPVPETYSKETALEFFNAYKGAPYDWLGVFGTKLRFIPQDEGKFFCSEFVAHLLSLPKPRRQTPKSIGEIITGVSK